MSLSPAALHFRDDLYLLTRLPLPKEADLDAIKERVFGSESGCPRTEDESRRRYVDEIVLAFDVSGAENLDEFAESVENGKRIAIDGRKLGDLADENKDLNRIVSQQDDAMQSLRERYDALDEKCAALCTERDAARREAAAAHTELCDLNAEISRLRSSLASTRAAHAKLTADHAKLAAGAMHHHNRVEILEKALTHAREEAKTAHDALTAEQGRTERLRAVMVDLIADLNAAKEGGE